MYVEDAAKSNDRLSFEVITPEERGCQLSVLTGENGKDLFDHLTKQGVIADWREPNVIRMAPVPLIQFVYGYLSIRTDSKKLLT